MRQILEIETKLTVHRFTSWIMRMSIFQIFGQTMFRVNFTMIKYYHYSSLDRYSLKLYIPLTVPTVPNFTPVPLFC